MREVRLRIDPDPAEGRKVAQRLMAQLLELYPRRFSAARVAEPITDRGSDHRRKKFLKSKSEVD